MYKSCWDKFCFSFIGNREDPGKDADNDDGNDKKSCEEEEINNTAQ